MVRRSLKLFAWVVAVSALLAGVWSVAVEPARLVVRQVTLRLPSWPPGLDGLRVAALADFHIGSPHMGLGRLQEIVTRVNREEPDLIVLLGDYVIHGVVGGRFVEPEAIAPVLGDLRARLGVVAVLGNHDWWLDGPRVRRSLEGAGLTVLDDEVLRLDRQGTALWLAGLGDAWTRTPDVAGTLGKVQPGEAIVVLTHNPDLFPRVPARALLTLAGHTHGGQVRLPLVGAPVVPSEFGQRYVAGHVVEEGRHLYVTTGLGTSILPVRLGVPPEIVVLTLTGDLPRPASSSMISSAVR